MNALYVRKDAADELAAALRLIVDGPWPKEADTLLNQSRWAERVARAALRKWEAEQ